MSTETYDGLGFDPAPGVPESVGRLVTTLSRVGNQLNETQGSLSRLGRSGIWEGDAAAGFSKKVGELPKYLSDGHGSLIEAAQVLHHWQSQLIDFQALRTRYESEAEEVRRTLKEAEASPDLKLAGRTFDTDAALAAAQKRLDYAAKKVSDATGDLNSLISKAQELLANHEEAARATAAAIRRAAERAPDEPGLFDRFMDEFKDIGDKIKDFANSLWGWIQKNADMVYKIGDWLDYASAACDVLAVVFSETVIGAAVFEAIGMTLNTYALAFHAVGWAAGAKKGSWTDISLDLAGFVPFGDMLRMGKVGKGAFKGVKIPLDTFQSGVKAADAVKRADDIIEAVGGTARHGGDRFMKSMGVVGKKVDAIHITADKFSDRLAVAAAKEFGDANLYKAGTKMVDGAFQKVVPKLVESTPLGRIPALADSIKPITNEAGHVVGKYVDPRSWTARGYAVVTGAKGLYTEGVRLATEPSEYNSEKVHQTVDRDLDTASRLVERVAGLNPFG